MGAENWARLPLAKLVIEFCGGMLIGYSVACLILNLNYYSFNLNFSKFFHVRRSPAVIIDTDIDVHSYEAFRNSTGTTFPTLHQSPDEGDHARDDVEPQRLAKRVRVLCWIMTGPSNHERKAIHVKNTWGKRCNKLIFMSSVSDEKLGAVGLPNVKEGRDWLWAKTKEAFKYVWEHHRNDAEWFFKADDDTYAIVENLRYMLSQFDPQNPIYFGARFRMRPFVNDSYMSGGCGYVLSREALRRFVEQALPDKNKCRQSHDGREDIEMGRCLEAVGVEAGDSTDAFGRHRFFHFPPAYHAMPGYIQQSSWYWKSIYYPQSQVKSLLEELLVYHVTDNCFADITGHSRLFSCGYIISLYQSKSNVPFGILNLPLADFRSHVGSSRMEDGAKRQEFHGQNYSYFKAPCTERELSISPLLMMIREIYNMNIKTQILVQMDNCYIRQYT